MIGVEAVHAPEAKVCLVIEPEDFELGSRMIRGENVREHHLIAHSPESGRHIDGHEIYQAFSIALVSLLLGMPRVAHPFTRALQGSLARPEQGFRLEFCLLLYRARYDTHISLYKLMEFSTQQFDT